jgi:diguanylate cyclase (GGDEF)-like protein
MSVPAALKTHGHWAVLGASGVLIALAGLAVLYSISSLELKRDAETIYEQVERIATEHPGQVLDAMENPAFAPALGELIGRTGFGHRVLRYELFNEKGELIFSGGGLSGIALDAAKPAEDVGVPHGMALKSRQAETGPTHFASIGVPLEVGPQSGTLVLFVDQSAEVLLLSSYLNWFGLAALILLVSGIGVPAMLAWRRSHQQRNAEEQLRYLEKHDAVTGLPNRRTFMEQLDKALGNTFRDRSQLAVLCLDIDRFKEINETSSHAGGDALLRELGARVKQSVRESDFVGRLSGDEFGVALTDLQTLGDVMAYMTRLIDALKTPFKVDDRDVLCTTSMGVAIAHGDGDSAATLLKNADIALARAKADGGQRMCFFETGMDQAVQRRRILVEELRLALARSEFEVVYQPQFNLETETQCGCEALIRWQHPVHGRISPMHFISVAEETGLIVPLGEWVLRQACSDAVKWPEPLTVAVNLSPAQFRDGDIVELVADVLMETGLPPRRLELEITESLLINDTEEVLAKLNRLGDLGVAIAMDDFGTGYSSLSYLARFPFNKIKIDRSFVRNMTRDPAVNAIVKTIIGLGKSLGVTITAEGVETEEQAALFRDYGCPQVQGFLYGYPGTAESSVQQARKPKLVKRRDSAA